MTDSQADTPSQSGAILKTAREEKALSIEQVADSLHLRPSVVKSIEEGQFDTFSSDVFLKGYFRTYCRLLQLDEVKMMSLLEQQLLHRQAQAECQENVAQKKQQTKKLKRAITILFFVIAISIIAFGIHYYSDSFTSRSNTSLTDKTEKSEPQIIADSNIGNLSEQSQVELTMLSTDQNSSSDLANESSQSREIQSTASSLNPPIIEEPSSQITQEDLVESNSIPQQETFEENEASISAANVEPNFQLLPIEAVFTGDCWFKLTDASGKTLVAALKRNEDLVKLNGKAPFHLVIGNALSVQLTFNGKEVDLTPFTSRNGRAELTLSP